MNHSPDHHRRNSTSVLDKVHLGKDIDIAIGATAIALAGNELLNAKSDKHHRTSHFVKAGLGAAVALGAYQMFRKEQEGEQPKGRRGRDRHEEEREHAQQQPRVVAAPPQGAREGDDARRRSRSRSLRRRVVDRTASESPPARRTTSLPAARVPIERASVSWSDSDSGVAAGDRAFAPHSQQRSRSPHRGHTIEDHGRLLGR